jgi:hypothetical protein
VERLAASGKDAVNDILMKFQGDEKVIRVVTMHAAQWWGTFGAFEDPNSPANANSDLSALKNRCFALRTSDRTGLVEDGFLKPQDWKRDGRQRFDASCSGVHGTLIKVALSERPNSTEILVVVHNHLTYVSVYS